MLIRRHQRAVGECGAVEPFDEPVVGAQSLEKRLEDMRVSVDEAGKEYLSGSIDDPVCGDIFRSRPITDSCDVLAFDRDISALDDVLSTSIVQMVAFLMRRSKYSMSSLSLLASRRSNRQVRTYDAICVHPRRNLRAPPPDVLVSRKTKKTRALHSKGHRLTIRSSDITKNDIRVTRGKQSQSLIRHLVEGCQL